MLGDSQNVYETLDLLVLGENAGDEVGAYGRWRDTLLPIVYHAPQLVAALRRTSDVHA